MLLTVLQLLLLSIIVIVRSIVTKIGISSAMILELANHLQQNNSEQVLTTLTNELYDCDEINNHDNDDNLKTKVSMIIKIGIMHNSIDVINFLLSGSVDNYTDNNTDSNTNNNTYSNNSTNTSTYTYTNTNTNNNNSDNNNNSTNTYNNNNNINNNINNNNNNNNSSVNITNNFITNNCNTRKAAIRNITKSILIDNTTEYVPLLLAIQLNCSIELIKELINNNANLFYQDNLQRNLLHHAIKYNCSVEVVELLVSNGVDINSQDYIFRTPLHFAVIQNRSIDTIKLLINNDTDINNYDIDKKSILHSAVKYCSIDVIKLLISSGATLFHRDINCYMILHTAAESNVTMDVMELVLNCLSNDDINKVALYYRTSLHIAARFTKTFEPIQLLLSRNADYTSLDYYGMTPYDYAQLYNKDMALPMKQVITIA